MKFTLLAALAALTFGTFSQAGGDITPISEPIVIIQENTDKNIYVGGSLTYVNTKAEQNFGVFTASQSESGYGLGGQIGFIFFRADAFAAAVEGRIQGTQWDYANDLDDAYALTYSALLKPIFNFDAFNAYGLFGYGSSKVAGNHFSVRENGFVYGVGAGYSITESIEVIGDIVANPSIREESIDINTNVLTVGVNYKF